MFRGEYEPKGGGAACVAGRAGKGRCLYENASRQTDLWMAKRDDRTILRGGQGESRPALCAHAWDTEHAGAVFPDSSCAKYQEAGGLFLSRVSSLSIILPLRLCLNAGVCQWSERPARESFPARAAVWAACLSAAPPSPRCGRAAFPEAPCSCSAFPSPSPPARRALWR